MRAVGWVPDPVRYARAVKKAERLFSSGAKVRYNKQLHSSFAKPWRATMASCASEPAVGIDLGTTFSAIAFLDQEGRPRTIPNLEGEPSTPSAVYFSSAGTVVGREAIKAARFEPDAVAQCVKRDMGKPYCRRPICGQRLPPEVVQAFILRKLREDAQVRLGAFSKVVVTVPAFFNEPRRKATMDAGALADLEVIDIINEPTAAAIAYGVQQGFVSPSGQTSQLERILVYDLGGGTFDATLMEIEGCNYRAVATDGDVYLGGIDWDRRIADHLAQRIIETCGEDPREQPEAMQALMLEAEDAKRALTARDKVAVHFAHGTRRTSMVLTRAEFEAMSEDLLGRTLFTCNSLLREAGFGWRDLTRVLLVGGSSRMPMVQRALEQESGMKVDRSLLSEEPVAMGAALYAGFLLKHQAGARPTMNVRNVNSHHLGVLGVERATGMPRRKILIPRNTPLPAEGSGRFSTLRDNQTGVLIEVVEGGDDTGRNATPIGRCIVSGLPPGLPAGTRVLVRFAYRTNGRLTVAASLAGTEHRVTMAIERASGLSAPMIRQWKQRIEQGRILDVVPQEEAALTRTEGVDQTVGELVDFGLSTEPPSAVEGDDALARFLQSFE